MSHGLGRKYPSTTSNKAIHSLALLSRHFLLPHVTPALANSIWGPVSDSTGDRLCVVRCVSGIGGIGNKHNLSGCGGLASRGHVF